MSAQTPTREPGRAYAEPAHILAEWAKWVIPPGTTWWLSDSLVAASEVLLLYVTLRLIFLSMPWISKLLRKIAELLDQVHLEGQALNRKAKQALKSRARAVLLWAL